VVALDSYPRPSVTADVVVWAVRAGSPHVLLIRRRAWPFEGHWALPGGFMEITETLEEAARRELAEETGLTDVVLEPLRPFDRPDRDPRKRVITMAYLALVPGEDADLAVRAGDDATDVAWWPLAQLPPLAFDHDEVIAAARAHLRRRLLTEDLGRHRFPDQFTARQLARAFSRLLGEPVAARPTLRLLRAAGVVEPLGGGWYRYRSRP